MLSKHTDTKECFPSRHLLAYWNKKLRSSSQSANWCAEQTLLSLGLKVPIPKLSDTSSKEKKQIQCSVCKTTAKSIIYAFESGHIICKSCQCCDAEMKGGKEGGDYEPEKEFDPDTEIPPLQIKKSNRKPTALASGDHESEFNAQELKDEVKKSCKEDDTLFIYKELHPKKSIKTIMEYKNSNFQESSVSPSLEDSSKNTVSIEEEDDVESCDKDPRPVVCPVTICSKIVTIDSFMLHFLFDHSKVPRATLDDTTPQEVILKSTNFTTEIQCVSTFIIETQKRPSQKIKKKMESAASARNVKKDNKLLLLLSVRLPTSSVKLPNVKCDPSAIFTRSIHTQTDKNNETDSGDSTECLSKSGSDYKSCTNSSALDMDEVFLLWLCQLDDTDRVFSITLLGEDKRRGHCYIGEAVHVRDKQDPSLLYDRSECLIVKGSAINRLFDPEGQITAIVSLIG